MRPDHPRASGGLRQEPAVSIRQSPEAQRQSDQRTDCIQKQAAEPRVEDTDRQRLLQHLSLASHQPYGRGAGDDVVRRDDIADRGAKTLGRQGLERLLEWGIGSIVLAPLLSVVVGVTLYLLALGMRKTTHGR